MKAHIITIGTEILIGQIVDTNSTWLASELVKIGFTVDRIVSIPDIKEDILETLESSLQKADLIIFTGGLGPTNDDITKTTLSEYFQSNLIFSDIVYSDVESFLKRRGGKMNALNNQQALVPESAHIIRNKQGTAPGLMFKSNKKICISLPGVPSEMKSIMLDSGLQVIADNFKLPYIYYHTTLITGVGESYLAERIESWESNLPSEMELAYLPSPGIIKLRLGLKGDNEAEIKQMVQNELEKLYVMIPDLIFGEGDTTFEQVIAEQLYSNKLTISTAESCSGGNIAKLFTSIPGSSQWYNGSVVAYSNEIKTNVLDVSSEVINKYGAVSEQVVKEMAKNVREKFSSDFSIATSGIAGPTGGTSDKPVGTVWIAISSLNCEIAQQFVFGNERMINIKRTSIAAMNMLREQLALL